jgi:hypothetical protein
VHEEHGRREGDRDDGIAVREPAHGRPVRVVDREEKQREPGHPRRPEHPAVHGADREEREPEPHQAVHVHQPRRARPELVVEPLGQRRQRPPEREAHGGAHRPREVPRVDRGLPVLGDAVGEAEQVERVARRDERRLVLEQGRVQVVVGDEARADRRSAHEHAEERDPRDRRAPREALLDARLDARRQRAAGRGALAVSNAARGHTTRTRAA